MGNKPRLNKEAMTRLPISAVLPSGAILRQNLITPITSTQKMSPEDGGSSVINRSVKTMTIIVSVCPNG